MEAAKQNLLSSGVMLSLSIVVVSIIIIIVIISSSSSSSSYSSLYHCIDNMLSVSPNWANPAISSVVSNSNFCYGGILLLFFSKYNKSFMSHCIKFYTYLYILCALQIFMYIKQEFYVHHDISSWTHGSIQVLSSSEI